jgi:3-hydroxyisobutyrate dehydrogenase-like beta-hydroxyacid dehydrogenase
MTRVGIVGLGRMGSRIAQRLAESGFEVTGWDRNAESVRALREAGIAVAANARDVAMAGEFVLSSVTEDEGVRAVFTGPAGFLETDVQGKLFIEMSTLRPQTGRELAALVEARGGAFIDSPVLGSLTSIPRGALQALVGGSSEDVERARPIHATLTRRVDHMGPVGTGYAMKLVANVGLAVYLEALGEALAMGNGEGLALDAMLEVLTNSPVATNWITNRRAILTGDADDVTLDIRTMRKDVVSALATGSTSGVSMPVTAGALAAFSAAVAAGWGEGDIGQIARFVREEIVQRFT